MNRGELKEAYLTFGGYDFVVIAEAPGDEVTAKFLMRIASDGHNPGRHFRALNVGSSWKKFLVEFSVKREPFRCVIDISAFVG